MSSLTWFTRFMITALAFVLCGGPQFAAAQQSTAPATQTQSQDQSAPSDEQTVPATSDAQAQPVPQQDQNVGTSQESATPDPSKGPLKPNDSTLPNAPSATQPTNQQSSSRSDRNQPKEAPLGAAAAQAGKTTGGTASKPAGTAIAPAKQHQTRSLLIKVGAVAAAGLAAGIVYGLSRSSPSVPPGARTNTAAVQGAR